MEIQIQSHQAPQKSSFKQIESLALKIAEPESSRSLRTSLRLLKYRLTPTPQIAPKGKYVGELQEQWAFPSDHLPIGMNMDGLNIVSWNVLNPAFISWVFENSQGLSHSLIAEEHKTLPASKITLREQHVIDSLKEMLTKQSLISLQECGMNFLKELEGQLPPHWKIAREKKGYSKDQNVVLYDSRVLELKENQSIGGIFSVDRKREKIQDALFERKENGDFLRVINVHLSGEPGNPAPRELAEYLVNTEMSDVSTIAMGDMNFNELEMANGFADVSSYQLFAPYCTNVAPFSLESKAIDHFLVKAPHSVILQSAEELISGLQSIVNLLDMDTSQKK